MFLDVCLEFPKILPREAIIYSFCLSQLGLIKFTEFPNIHFMVLWNKLVECPFEYVKIH